VGNQVLFNLVTGNSGARTKILCSYPSRAANNKNQPSASWVENISGSITSPSEESDKGKVNFSPVPDLLEEEGKGITSAHDWLDLRASPDMKIGSERTDSAAFIKGVNKDAYTAGFAHDANKPWQDDAGSWVSPARNLEDNTPILTPQEVDAAIEDANAAFDVGRLDEKMAQALGLSTGNDLEWGDEGVNKLRDLLELKFEIEGRQGSEAEQAIEDNLEILNAEITGFIEKNNSFDKEGNFWIDDNNFIELDGAHWQRANDQEEWINDGACYQTENGEMEMAVDWDNDLGGWLSEDGETLCIPSSEENGEAKMTLKWDIKESGYTVFTELDAEGNGEWTRIGLSGSSSTWDNDEEGWISADRTSLYTSSDGKSWSRDFNEDGNWSNWIEVTIEEE
jgi:hypothetical protein